VRRSEKTDARYAVRDILQIRLGAVLGKQYCVFGDQTAQAVCDKYQRSSFCVRTVPEVGQCIYEISSMFTNAVL
jgi:hypothetical protein